MKIHTEKLLRSALPALAFGAVAPTLSAADVAHDKTHAASSRASEEHPLGIAGGGKQDETIKFVVQNSGKPLQEMVIGNMESLKGLTQ